MTDNVRSPRSPSLRTPLPLPGTFPAPALQLTASSSSSSSSSSLQPQRGLAAGARVPRMSDWTGTSAFEDCKSGPPLPSRKATLSPPPQSPRKREREEGADDPHRHREPGESKSDKKARSAGEGSPAPTLTPEQAEAFITRHAGALPHGEQAQADWCDAVIRAALNQLEAADISRVGLAMWSRLRGPGTGATRTEDAAHMLAQRIAAQALPLDCGSTNDRLAALLHGLVHDESGAVHTARLPIIAEALEAAVWDCEAVTLPGLANLGAILALALGGCDIQPGHLTALLETLAPCGPTLGQQLWIGLTQRRFDLHTDGAGPLPKGHEGPRITATAQFIAILQAIRPTDGTPLAPQRWSAVTEHLVGGHNAWGYFALSRLLDLLKDDARVLSLLEPVLAAPAMDPNELGQACWTLGMAWLEAQGRPLVREAFSPERLTPLDCCVDPEAAKYEDMVRELFKRAQGGPQSFAALARLGEGLSHAMRELASRWDQSGFIPGKPRLLADAWAGPLRHAGVSPGQALAFMMKVIPALDILLSVPRAGGLADEALQALHGLAPRLWEAPVAEWTALRQGRSTWQAAWQLVTPQEMRELQQARSMLTLGDALSAYLKPGQAADMDDKTLRARLYDCIRQSDNQGPPVDPVMLGVGLASLAPWGSGQRRIVTQALQALFAWARHAANHQDTTTTVSRVVQGLMLGSPEWVPEDTLRDLLAEPIRGSLVTWQQGMVHLIAGTAQALCTILGDARIPAALGSLLRVTLAEYNRPGQAEPDRPLLSLTFLPFQMADMSPPEHLEGARRQQAARRNTAAFVDTLLRTPALHADAALARLTAAWMEGLATNLGAAPAAAIGRDMVDTVLQGRVDPQTTGHLVTGLLLARAAALAQAAATGRAVFEDLALAAAHLSPTQLGRVLLAHGAAYSVRMSPTVNATQLAQAGLSREHVAILAYWHAHNVQGLPATGTLPIGVAALDTKSAADVPSPPVIATPEALMAAWKSGTKMAVDPLRTLRVQSPHERLASLELLFTMGRLQGRLNNGAGLLQEILGWPELESKLQSAMRLVDVNGVRLRPLDFRALRQRLTADIQALLDADPKPDGKAERDPSYREVIAGRTVRYRKTRERYEEASSQLTAAYEKLPRAFGAEYGRDPRTVTCEKLQELHAFLVEELVDVTRPGTPDMVARPVMTVIEREARRITEALDHLARADALAVASSSSVSTQTMAEDARPLDADH